MLRPPQRASTARLDSLARDEELEEQDEEPAPRVSADAPADPSEARRMARAIRRKPVDSDVRKGAAVLEQQPLLPYSAALRTQLDALHRPEALLPAIEVDAAPLQVTTEQLLKVLRRIKPGRAPEPSGMMYEHIIVATFRNVAAINAMLRTVDLLLAGKAPHAADALDRRLLATRTPTYGHARLIAVNEEIPQPASLFAPTARSRRYS